MKGLIGWGWALGDETGYDRGPNGGENSQHAAHDAALLCPLSQRGGCGIELRNAALTLRPGWCPLTYICNVPPSPVFVISLFLFSCSESGVFFFSFFAGIASFEKPAAQVHDGRGACGL